MLLEEVYRLEREKKCSIIPGVYSFSFPSSILTAGSTQSKSTNIQSDSHFISRYVMCATYDAGLVLSVATAPLKIQLLDTGSGRFLFDDFVPTQTICGGNAAAAGQGSLPFIWPEPWLIRAGGTAQAQLKNVGGATVVEADIVLVGLKVYPLSGSLADLGI